MRPIKFRGKRVDTGEWVYGSNIHKVILNDTKEELWVIHPKGEPIEHLGDGYIKYRPPVVITESIGQYTGLKDKNGKEIYEYNELDGAYEVIFKDLKYSLRHISNNDIIGLQDYWRDKNGEIEVTREYTKV